MNLSNFTKSKNILMVDDGGFIFSNPDSTGFYLEVEAYDRILQLAKINEIKINSIRDNNFFNIDSVKILYTIPLNNFLMMTDDNQNIYVSMVKKFEIQKRFV